MSSPLSIKRRKLDDATAKLKKPFVSPMRASKPGQASNGSVRSNAGKANVGLQEYVPSTLAHTVKPAYSFSAPKVANPASTPSAATPLRKQPSFTWSTTKKKASAEEQAARKAANAVWTQIRNVEKELDILKQAEQLATTSTDAELEALSEKWRHCSQAVAEELFGTVKERVQRMGGVAAWREMEKRKYERAHGLGEFAQEEEPEDDGDCEFDSQGEELPEEEQEYRKKMKRQAKQEAMDAAEEPDKPDADPGGKKQIWQEESNAEDDSFTMDMMLRSLNIDLKVIGYDKAAQRWIA
ncbi:Swi5-dependent recombination DNA repair protein 1 [Pseudocercospora fuligena]|uniref:Swi5-dependent recombination DNA repair protein 1 n=1 Tax=Pseudocercospora fuligena TaxID=685502 RepID=A0A8H6RWX5_9PEZI|nr:Swi5-dependent recombination DNA repair protein 1 [Pseudocercospora fuligena]